ncbi:MAG TPA: HoxN/HupN/NixA family nickel/cobalt transporter [Actinomycetota bacterium]|nr:HoxN/HupN/NixA family nickel/cobalt transporter [Actinomycetota bacterium]
MAMTRSKPAAGSSPAPAPTAPKAQPTGHWRFSRGEWFRLGGLFGSVGLLHLVGWGLFLYYHNQFGPLYAGAGAIAYTLGLRHAFDADHIAAIDDTTRFLLQKGKRPLGVGFFFSLGHSTVVLALSVAIALAAQAVSKHVKTFSQIGSVVGGSISATFLWVLGIFNLIVLIGLIRLWRGAKQGRYETEELDELLSQRGLLNRVLGKRFRNFINSSWQMYPVGLLFGLGFDTASQVGLIAISAAAATGKGGTQVPALGIIALPLIFAAGMSLMDTADGAFMSRAYGWAFTNPLRKIYYNITMTGLSVFVALVIGTIEFIQVIAHGFHVDNGVVQFLGNIDFQTLGFFIVGAFVVTWIGSVVLFKVRRVEERYGGAVTG